MITTRETGEALKFAIRSDDAGDAGAFSIIPFEVPRASVVSKGELDEELTKAKPFAGMAVLGVIVIDSTLNGATITVCGCTEYGGKLIFTVTEIGFALGFAKRSCAAALFSVVTSGNQFCTFG